VGNGFFHQSPYSPKCVMGRGNSNLKLQSLLTSSEHVNPRVSLESGLFPPHSPENGFECHSRQSGTQGFFYKSPCGPIFSTVIGACLTRGPQHVFLFPCSTIQPDFFFFFIKCLLHRLLTYNEFSGG